MVLRNQSRTKGELDFQMHLMSKERRCPSPTPQTHVPGHQLTLETVLLSCPVIPDKSASKLNKLVRPIRGSISSRLYVPEMENLGKCKSNRLGRESDGGSAVSLYVLLLPCLGSPSFGGEMCFPEWRDYIFSQCHLLCQNIP